MTDAPSPTSVARPGPRGRRRAAIALALLAAAAALAALPTCSPRPAQRHVIVVLVDTLRRDALGCYGNADGVTPNLDALAAEGVRFEQAISTSGWTLPAVASLLTGTWPTIHGGMGKGTAVFPIREGLPTAAEWFLERGYRTCAITNATFVSPYLGFDRGFQLFDHRDAYNIIIRRADETIDAALDFLREHRADPCFVFVHIFDPHLDYDPPEDYRTRFTRGRELPAAPLSMEACRALQSPAGPPPAPADIAYVRGVYHGEVAFVDAQIGRLADELRRLGLYDAAAVVVTSDHGEEFWDHGGFEHGHTLYDELVHIPLIMKLPAGAPRPAAPVGAQVRIIDVLPTLFDLLGWPAPESFAGVSLLPWLRGERGDDLIAFCESTMYGSDKLAWRDGAHKYIHDLDPEAEVKYELYNWREDPGETVNLFDRDPHLAHRYHQELARFYEDLKKQAARLPPTRLRDLSPQQIESLRSLGYVR
ncbi:MAG: sulfatase [Candidatus Eisenbacteria bacterium]|uniref:Sulfatase n=1 Tax=Eiseniibacteriota bacterium TaxID=2212470 RepID=A0A938BRX1_UNCEI|nr:sulfatase [Candidatus Eisenbacteria bacterium]